MTFMLCPRDQLIATIAGVQAQNKGLTQPERSLILKTEGPYELIRQVFEEDLLNIDREAPLEAAAKALEDWENAGYDVIPIFDDRYPHRLRQVHDAPGLIFSEGSQKPSDRGVSVVGSRTATISEARAAADVARCLVDLGVTVVSGLALGIDATAHEATLSQGGRTVAVIGTGLDQTYPTQHAKLRERISRSGQIITQFFPDTPVAKRNFPMRNATMSGYCGATIVIAAGENSGTKHQARAAIGHGRALILTPSVVAKTTWGKEYVDKHQALIAKSPQEAADLAHEALLRTEQINDIFV